MEREDSCETPAQDFGFCRQIGKGRNHEQGNYRQVIQHATFVVELESTEKVRSLCVKSAGPAQAKGLLYTWLYN